MISFEHVTKRYGERLALDDVSWRMEEGECAVVLGHSAAGKTTLLRLITHETQPTSGTVTVPDVGCVSWVMSRSSVVLPAALWPRTTAHSPSSIRHVTSSSARRSP